MARMEISDVNKAELTARSATPDALFNLGLMYSSGRERSPDLVSAHKWFNLAAMQGNAPARDYRSEISREMSSDEIAEAQRQAREWLYGE